MATALFSRFLPSQKRRDQKAYVSTLEPEIQSLIHHRNLKVLDPKVRADLDEFQRITKEAKERKWLLQALGLKPWDPPPYGSKDEHGADEVCRDGSHLWLACGHRSWARHAPTACGEGCASGDMDIFRRERSYAKKNKGRTARELYAYYLARQRRKSFGLEDEEETAAYCSDVQDRAETLDAEEDEDETCEVCLLRRSNESFFYVLQEVSYDAELLVAQEGEAYLAPATSSYVDRRMVDFQFRNPDGSLHVGSVPAPIWQVWLEEGFAFINAVGTLINSPEYQADTTPPAHEAYDGEVFSPWIKDPNLQVSRRRRKAPNVMPYFGSDNVPAEERLVKEYFLFPEEMRKKRNGKPRKQVSFDLRGLPPRRQHRGWRPPRKDCELHFDDNDPFYAPQRRPASPPPRSPATSSVASSNVRNLTPSARPANCHSATGVSQSRAGTYEHLRNVSSFQSFVEHSLTNPPHTLPHPHPLRSNPVSAATSPSASYKIPDALPFPALGKGGPSGTVTSPPELATTQPTPVTAEPLPRSTRTGRPRCRPLDKREAPFLSLYRPIDNGQSKHKPDGPIPAESLAAKKQRKQKESIVPTNVNPDLLRPDTTRLSDSPLWQALASSPFHRDNSQFPHSREHGPGEHNANQVINQAQALIPNPNPETVLRAEADRLIFRARLDAGRDFARWAASSSIEPSAALPLPLELELTPASSAGVEGRLAEVQKRRANVKARRRATAEEVRRGSSAGTATPELGLYREGGGEMDSDGKTAVVWREENTVQEKEGKEEDGEARHVARRAAARNRGRSSVEDIWLLAAKSMEGGLEDGREVDIETGKEAGTQTRMEVKEEVVQVNGHRDGDGDDGGGEGASAATAEDLWLRYAKESLF